MFISTILTAAAAFMVMLLAVNATPNPCRAGEKRDLDLFMHDVQDEGFGPWRLFNVCIFQSNNEAAVNSSTSFTFVDKNRGMRLTETCESKDHYDVALFGVEAEAFQCPSGGAMSWNYVDSKLAINRNVFEMTLTPDNWSPETGLNTVVIGGWISTADWARTSLPEGLYIYRNYQEMTWSRV